MAEEEIPKDQTEWSMDKATLMRIDSLLRGINYTMLEGKIIPQKKLLDVLSDEVIPFVKPEDEKTIFNLREETNKLMNKFGEFVIGNNILPNREQDADDFFDSIIEFKYPKLQSIFDEIRPKLKEYNLTQRKLMKKYGLLMKSKKDSWNKDED